LGKSVFPRLESPEGEVATRGTKPLVMYVAHVADMLLQKWFPLEGHQMIGWFVKTRYEEDEEGIIQPIVSNLTPIAFQAIEATMVFINEDLRSLHVSLPKTKIGYRITVFPTGKRLATKGEVIKKAKMDQETPTTFKVGPFTIAK